MRDYKMGHSSTLEYRKLRNADLLINKYVHSYQDRVKLLECIASRNSGFDLQSFYDLTYPGERVWSDEHPIIEIENAIMESGIPLEYAICSLIREQISIEEQKKNGVFYTDYRLADLIVSSVKNCLGIHSRVCDLSAGSGILLTGVAREYKKLYSNNFNNWISNSLFAFDLSEWALRGASAAIISLTKDVGSIISMISNWRVCDSLFDISPEVGLFDIVVGNPPWGRIKLSTPTYLSNIGLQHVYGSTYGIFDENEYNNEKKKVIEYSKKVKSKYSLLKKGEPDNYMAFLQCAIDHIVPNGRVSYIVPGGIIRSENTHFLREYLIDNAGELKFTLLSNRANYFSIDSRFKFCIVEFTSKTDEKSINSIFLRIFDGGE